MKRKSIFVLSAFFALVLSGCSLLPQLPGQNQRPSSNNPPIEEYSEKASVFSSEQRSSSNVGSSSSRSSAAPSSSSDRSSSSKNSSSSGRNSSSSSSKAPSTSKAPTTSSSSSYYDQSSSSEPYSSEGPRPKVMPTIGSVNYDVDYLTYDNEGYVTGISYIPEDGVLFIDAPIRNHVFEYKSGFTATFLGPNCTFIGEQAFLWCESLKYVIIDSDTFPELVYDTWSCTWSWEGFGVYVRDDMFEDVYALQTADNLWNIEHRTEIKKMSTLPTNLHNYLGLNIIANSKSIEYSLSFNDPDNALTYFDVGLVYNNEFIDVKDNLLTGTFTNLFSNMEYSIRVRYSYDLGNGYGEGSNEVYRRVTTKAISEPHIAIADYSAAANYLAYDNDGYVIGISHTENIPGDGVLCINAPIKERAFYFINGFSTIILGPGCTYIGKEAFYNSGSLRTVIIDSDTFPELVDDTWGCIWSERNFYVYVYDNMFREVSSLDTGDSKWNENPRQGCLKQISELPNYLKQYVGFYVTSTSNSISYSLYFTDPDSAITSLNVVKTPGGGTNTGYGGAWGGISSNTEYNLEVTYGYDLNDGRGVVYKTANRTIKTKSLQEPSIINSKYLDAGYLNIDNDGYVFGTNCVPGDRIFYVNAPVRDRGLEYLPDVTTVYLGPGCTFLGGGAFYHCNALKTVILDSDTFPELVYDTFGYTWDKEDFHVYVKDAIYDDVLSLQTNDSNWNGCGLSNVVKKHSELPIELQNNLGFTTSATTDSISYQFSVVDPDSTIKGYDVTVYKANGEHVSSKPTVSSGTFTGLDSNTNYIISVVYRYNLNDGRGDITKTISKAVTTEAVREPRVGTANYDVDYLNYDGQGYVTGSSYVPEDGILFINAPIKEYAFAQANDVIAVYLGPECTYIGECAFQSCDKLRTVVVDSLYFPDITNDTWCITWNAEDFKVYVYDEIFDYVSTHDANDVHWNNNPRQNRLGKISELSEKYSSYLGFKVTTSNNSISFSLNFSDPDNVLIDYAVALMLGDNMIDARTFTREGTFTNLLNDTEYVLELSYNFDLNDGQGRQSKTLRKTVKTKALTEPEVVMSKLSSDELIIDNEGYVTGINGAPENGVLYINNPVRDSALSNLDTFHTVVINQGCTSLGSNAINYCFTVDTVIINRDSFPTLDNDTFCATWSHDEFHVYVKDEIYEQVKNLETGDYYWDVEHRDTQLYKFSDLTNDQQQLLNNFAIANSDSIEFDFRVNDPDNVVSICFIALYEGDTQIAIFYTCDGVFTGLNANTTYTIRISITFDLNNGQGNRGKNYEMSITTLS